MRHYLIRAFIIAIIPLLSAPKVRSELIWIGHDRKGDVDYEFVDITAGQVKVNSSEMSLFLRLAYIPHVLSFSRVRTPRIKDGNRDFTIEEYSYSLLMDIDGDRDTGNFGPCRKGYEIAISLFHIKVHGQKPFKASLLEGTEWKGVWYYENNWFQKILHGLNTIVSDNTICIKIPLLEELASISPKSRFMFVAKFLHDKEGFQEDTLLLFGEQVE